LKIQNQWVKSRRRLLKQIRSQIQSLLGYDPEVQNYNWNYKAEFYGNWQDLPLKQFLKDLQQVKVILGGDFHAFAQSQRTHLRVLREWPRKNQLLLALECFESSHQKWIDLFMANKIDESMFLQKIDWNKRWTYPWSHYKPLIDLAKSRSWRVYGLNKYFSSRSLRTLELRDQHSAKVIKKILSKHPEEQVFALFGDLHLSENHLPSEILKLKFLDRKDLALIFLNSERLYFKYFNKIYLTDQKILKKKPGKYCILSSPPWVKWQSYLMFLEGGQDHELGELHDIQDSICNYVKIIQSDLKIKKINYNEFSLYTAESKLAFQKTLKKLGTKDKKFYLNMLENEKTFFIAEKKIFFLSRFSVNHGAQVAGYFIISQLNDHLESLKFDSKNFLGLIWLESLSFFLSKFINPHRKAEDLKMIKSKFMASSAGLIRESLSLVLDQKTLEWIYLRTGVRKELRFKAKSSLAYFEASRILGSIFGERLYHSFLKNRIGKEEIRILLKFNPREKCFEDQYFSLLKKIEAHQNIYSERHIS